MRSQHSPLQGRIMKVQPDVKRIPGIGNMRFELIGLLRRIIKLLGTLVFFKAVLADCHTGILHGQDQVLVVVGVKRGKQIPGVALRGPI